MAINWFKKQFVVKPLRISEDKKKHRLNVLWGFLAAFLYSIFYGMFEKLYMHSPTGPIHTGKITHEINWAIMYSSVVIILALVNRGKIDQILLGLIFFLVFEDLVYFITYGIEFDFYPYPTYDWWDERLASCRVLGNLGQAIPFWPYVPLYYLPGFGVIILLYSLGFANAKAFRIANWILLPFLVSIVAGLMWTDTFAIICLIIIPVLSYCYILILFVLHKKGILSIEEEDIQPSKKIEV
ncbi:MAG: hypothetical protein FK733_04720, partial [Asgard group archaeon]|nr:hypothetical protein [Asgard group archaeon]